MEGLTDRTSVIVRNLTTGDKLQFRVRAYNMAGASGPATLAQPVTIREIMRKRLPGLISPPAYFCTAPLVLNKAPSKTFNSDSFCLTFMVFPYKERPKIWLPRHLRQTLVKKVGDTVNIVIPFQVRLSALQVICRPLLS